jgi:phage-related holin
VGDGVATNLHGADLVGVVVRPVRGGRRHANGDLFLGAIARDVILVSVATCVFIDGIEQTRPRLRARLVFYYIKNTEYVWLYYSI